MFQIHGGWVEVSIINNLQEYFHKTSLAFIKAVPTEMLTYDERAKYMCKFGCKNYNRKHSCPSESLTTLNTIKESHYKWAILFATTYQIPAPYTRYRIKALNRNKELEIQRICAELEGIMNFNGINHILLSSGPCRRCVECSMINEEPCKKPQLKQVSMEAVGIDCQKTMHSVGFDFQMPNNGSINRCGCILTNEEELSSIHFNSINSRQKFGLPLPKDTYEMCSRLVDEYPNLYVSVQMISLEDIHKGNSLCHNCESWGKNFACPPYSDKIDISLWNFAVLWKWRENDKKKNGYNIALKTIHGAFFSLGYYFALSLRDCYCDECRPCTYLSAEKPVCNSRKLLSPSMQSQGINPKHFGEGKFGLVLL